MASNVWLLYCYPHYDYHLKFSKSVMDGQTVLLPYRKRICPHLPHLLELFGPWFLSLLEPFLCLLGLLEASNHLLMIRFFLPVLHFFNIFVNEVVLHLLVQLTHSIRLCHHSQPGSLHRAILWTCELDYFVIPSKISG